MEMWLMIMAILPPLAKSILSAREEALREVFTAIDLILALRSEQPCNVEELDLAEETEQCWS